MKVCIDCKKEKDESKFHKHGGRKDGLQNMCKTCDKTRTLQYYNDNKEKWKTYRNRAKGKRKPRIPVECKICGKLNSNGSNFCGKHSPKNFNCLDCGKSIGHEGRCNPCYKQLKFRDVKREKNPNWRGGRTKSAKGYVFVNFPDHPRESGNYVLEHILIMEDYLGRYVNFGETVHHRNGIKDDNRIENLELWASNHPPGQRVYDQVKWAKELIDQYGCDENKYL